MKNIDESTENVFLMVAIPFCIMVIIGFILMWIRHEPFII